MQELLKRLLNIQNEFASGGLLLMIIGALGVYLRAVPGTLWQWCVSQMTMMITVNNEDTAFVWVKEWLLEQGFMKRIRRADMDTALRGEKPALGLAPGRYWFWHGRRPFTVLFYRGAEKRGWSSTLHESLTFTTIGRRQAFLKKFVDEIVACHHRNAGGRSKLFVYDRYWTRVRGYTPRQLESVILPPGEKEHLVQDLERFRASRQRYNDLGVPYHRGYLFHGPPGTGKTSLASALAERFGVSVYAINLAQFNDRTLTAAIHEVPANAMVLFEDIDCMNVPRARGLLGEAAPYIRASADDDEDEDAADAPGVTLSGLLNVLDGFAAPDNVLFMMTTNRIETLDAALLRPGRIDYRLFLGPARDQEKIDLYLRFLPDAPESEARAFVAQQRGANTMAEFQGALLGLEWRSPANRTGPRDARPAEVDTEPAVR